MQNLILHQDKDKKGKTHFWYTKTASNGKIKMTSETYTRSHTAKTSALADAKNMKEVRVYDHYGWLIYKS